MEDLIAALQSAWDFIDRYAEVEDGPYGPEPNAAMSLAMYIADVLDANDKGSI